MCLSLFALSVPWRISCGRPLSDCESVSCAPCAGFSPEPIFRNLADRLARDFLHGVNTRLPSIRRIAAHYGVAYRTAWLAMCELNRRTPKAPPPVPKTGKDRPQLPPSRQLGDSVRRLADQIKAAVTNGDFRAGTPLPKFDYFRAEYHVTQSTVTQAIRTLAGSGLVHGTGRRWIVGPSNRQTTSFAQATSDEGTVVFLAFQNQYTALFNYNTSHLAPFLFALRAETSRLGIHLSVVFREQIPENHPFSCNGPAEVRARIQELGNRYLGAIIIEPVQEENVFVDWVKALSGSDRPVVFFDSSDTRQEYTRSRLHLQKRYFRAFLDEESAIRLALAHCRAFGHRTLGFPVFDNPGYSWAPRRRDRAMEIAREIDRDLRILPSTHAEPFWEASDFAIKIDDIVTFAQRVERHANAKPASRATASVASARNAILRATPSIVQLLDAGVTALVSMNDRIAHQHYSWCRAAGIEVPRRLSMISFDNLPDTESLPVTTVDFGFPRLGYLCIHAIIGDVPVPSGRDGTIAGQCLLVSRGSVERL